MPLTKWKKLTEFIVSKNPWWTYRRDEFLLPNGKQGDYHYVHTLGSSLIVPVQPDGGIVLVNQYRYLRDKESIEFPCGGVKDGHSYDGTAVQELQEEAGYIARSWMVAGEFNPYNGVTDEICRVYVARDLQPVPPKPDNTEEFEVIALLPDEIDARIISGVIWDGMSIAAWAIAKTYMRPL